MTVETAMNHLFELYRPQLRNPVLLVAFAGWNDAAEVATGTLRYLMRQWAAEPCAEIEPEEFFVFTETRPQVRVVDNVQRQIVWPQNQFYYARRPKEERDVLFLIGAEPQLRWKTFSKLILDYSTDLGVSLLVGLGGLLAEVLHNRDPVLTGSIADPKLAQRVARLKLQRSRYEGPTGILGVLTSLGRERGLASGSIWGSVPHYIPSLTNPPIMEALASTVGDLLDLPVDLGELRRGIPSFTTQVDQAIAEDADVAAYIHHLERRERDPERDDDQGSSGEGSPPAAELPNADVLVQELDEFFRRRSQDSE